MELSRLCRRCGLNKNKFSFYKGENKKDGYYKYCKECRKIIYNKI
jgi:hypothetical protein